MKLKRFIAALLLMGILGITRNSFAAPVSVSPIPAGGERIEFTDVPYGHWAYPCVDKLHKLLQIPIPPFRKSNLWTRYEFAIFCLRLNGEHPVLNDPTAKDISYALNQEFAFEIRTYAARRDTDAIDVRVAAPPRLTIAPNVGNPGLRNPGYRGYVGQREFLRSTEVEDLKKEADKTEVPAK